MLNSAKTNEDLYIAARKLVTEVHIKVLKILKTGENVIVSNSEYMPCYKQFQLRNNYFVKAKSQNKSSNTQVWDVFHKFSKGIQVIASKFYDNPFNAVIKACDSSQEPGANKDEKMTNNEERLFHWFKELIKDYLKVDVEELNNILDAEQYIERVYKQYKNFQIYLHWLSRLFYYLDSFFLKNKNSTLHFEGFKLYRDDYFQIINQKLFTHIVGFQKLAREDQSIPRETIKKLIGIYQEVGFKKTVKLKKVSANSSEFVFEIDDGTKYYEDNFQAKLADEVNNYCVKIRYFISLNYVNQN